MHVLTVPNQKATANYVPAAAVIRRWQALSGIIGRKARVAQLDRACDYGSRGYGFDSYRARHLNFISYLITYGK